MRLTAPVVNMNGNTKESLVAEVLAIRDALDAAKKLIANSDLAHGRNFQFIGGESVRASAQQDMRENFETLHKLSVAYMQLAIDINEQGK